MKSFTILSGITFLFALFFFSSCSTNLDGTENSSSDSEESLLSSESPPGDVENAEAMKEAPTEDLGNLLSEEVVPANAEAKADVKNNDNDFASDFGSEGSNIQESSPTILAGPVAGGAFDPNGKFETYTAEKTETLMWVSFKLYGDYRMWKNLVKWNGSGISSAPLTKGQTIKYIPSNFSWQPKGNPYLIQKGDYLSKISYKVYGTHKKWKMIWDNNKPMIRYPDLIFAGFTLYYIPQAQEVAFQYQ